MERAEEHELLRAVELSQILLSQIHGYTIHEAFRAISLTAARYVSVCQKDNPRDEKIILEDFYRLFKHYHKEGAALFKDDKIIDTVTQ